MVIWSTAPGPRGWSPPEIGALQVLAAQQLGRRPLEHDLPGRHYVPPARAAHPHRPVLLHHHAPTTRRFPGKIAAPLAIRCGTDQLVTSSPLSSTRPERGRTMPRIVFSVVDLPDALPPSRQTSSPSPTWRVMPSSIRICP